MADTLNPGQSLRVNEQLQSKNGVYALVMQPDGNLVVYQTGGGAVWDSGTWTLAPQYRPTRADMQADGNFVLYNDLNNPAWATNTTQYPGSRLVIQDDRNLVIYTSGDKAVWVNGAPILPPDTPSQPVRVTENENVGYKKHMETTATLYRDGSLAVDSYTKNDNWTGGLRGEIFVLVIDSAGRKIWASNIFQCTTRCSIWDPSCASYGREPFFEQLPAEVGKHAETLEIYQGDGVNMVDIRNQLINVIKGTADVAQEIKDRWIQLGLS